MNWSAGKIGTIYQKPAQANGLSTPPIGCVLDLPGFPGAGNKIYDRSPYGNHGTIIGAVWKRLPSGLWYLDFDGTDDYFTVADAASLDITDAITIEYWLNFTHQAGYHQRVLSKNYLEAYEMRIAKEDDTLQFMLDLDGLKVVTTAVMTAGVWNQIVGTYDKDAGADNFKVYLNAGTPVTATQTVAIGTNSRNLLIGSNHLGDLELTGGIVLLRIYNRALSALEIQNHYQQEKYLFGVW